jgi:hypothetical protein
MPAEGSPHVTSTHPTTGETDQVRRKGAETLASAGTDDDLNTADVPASSGDGANLAVDTIFTCDDIADDNIKSVIPEETARLSGTFLA